MMSSGMLRRVALVRTDVSEDHSASFIRMTRIGELVTMEALSSSETSVLTRATRRNIPEHIVLQYMVPVYLCTWSGFQNIVP
jgi:hypothetical protein